MAPGTGAPLAAFNRKKARWPSPSTTGNANGDWTWSFDTTHNTATCGPDTHNFGNLKSYSFPYDGSTYMYAELASISCSFQDKMQRLPDDANPGEYDWGYTWNNNNDTWPNPPSPSSITVDGTNAGYTEAAYGGAIPEQNQGQYTTSNITIHW
jgi:hypothetical protein